MERGGVWSGHTCGGCGEVWSSHTCGGWGGVEWSYGISCTVYRTVETNLG